MRKLEDPEEDFVVAPKLYSVVNKTGHQIWLAFGFPLKAKGVLNTKIKIRYYYAWNPKTKLIDSKLEGHNYHVGVDGHIIMTPHIDNRKGTKLKGPILYRHLILGKGNSEKHIFVTNGSQSLGGLKIWQRTRKGISVHGIDAKGMPLNLDTIQDEDEIWTQSKKGDKDIAAVNLVMHESFVQPDRGPREAL